MIERLSLASVGRAPAGCRPRVLPVDLRPGIVHLGVGAFHRAHQAVFTEDADASAGQDWGIVGVAPRSRTIVDRLVPQDGLFSVARLSARVAEVRVIGVLASVIHAPADPYAVVGLIADPATRVVTLTVTEKAHRLDPASGRLRTEDPQVRADLETDRPPATIPGLLARGLAARARADAGPVTVLSCDNLPQNGRRLAGLVEQALGRMPLVDPDRTRAWVHGNVGFPCSMVDRIVPAPGARTRARAEAALGLADLAAVEAEPFTQWVIEDTFPGGRPAWEAAGATLTGDVAPWERMKLRVLNGGHSTLAYLGALAGCETIAEALALPGMTAYLERLLDRDVVPSLDPPPGIDPKAYCASVLERFANPAVEYRVGQVAMDGSQKLPQRILHTVADRRRVGAEPRFVALAVAAWMRFVAGRADDGRPLALDDPLAPKIRAALDGADDAAADTVDRLLGLDDVFPQELRDDDTFRGLVSDWLAALDRDGAAYTLASLKATA